MPENGAIGAALVIPSSLLKDIQAVDDKIAALAKTSEDTEKRMKTAFQNMANGVNPLVEALTKAQQAFGTFDKAGEDLGRQVSEGMKNGAKAVEDTNKQVAKLEQTAQNAGNAAAAAGKSFASISATAITVDVGMRAKRSPDAIKEELAKTVKQWESENGSTKRSVELATQVERLTAQYKELQKGAISYNEAQRKALEESIKATQTEITNYDRIAQKINDIKALKASMEGEIRSGRKAGADTAGSQRMAYELKKTMDGLVSAQGNSSILSSRWNTSSLLNNADIKDLERRAKAQIATQKELNNFERQSAAETTKIIQDKLKQHEAYQKKRADAAEKAALAEVKADEKAAAQIAANRNRLEEQIRNLRAKDNSLSKVGYNNFYGGAQLKENIGQQIKQLQSILYDPKKLKDKATVTNAVGDVNAIKAQADYIIKANENLKKEAKARTKAEEQEAKARQRAQEQEVNTYAVNVRRMLQAQNALRSQEKNLMTTQADLSKRGLQKEAEAMQITIEKSRQLQSEYAKLAQSKSFLVSNKRVGDSLALQLGMTSDVSAAMRTAREQITAHDSKRAADKKAKDTSDSFEKISKSADAMTARMEKNAARVDNAYNRVQQKLFEIARSANKNNDAGISNWVTGLAQAREKGEQLLSTLDKIRKSPGALKDNNEVSLALAGRTNFNGQAQTALTQSRQVRSQVIADERAKQKAAEDAAKAAEDATRRIEADAKKRAQAYREANAAQLRTPQGAIDFAKHAGTISRQEQALKNLKTVYDTLPQSTRNFSNVQLKLKSEIDRVTESLQRAKAARDGVASASAKSVAKELNLSQISEQLNNGIFRKSGGYFEDAIQRVRQQMLAVIKEGKGEQLSFLRQLEPALRSRMQSYANLANADGTLPKKYRKDFESTKAQVAVLDDWQRRMADLKAQYGRLVVAANESFQKQAEAARKAALKTQVKDDALNINNLNQQRVKNKSAEMSRYYRELEKEEQSHINNETRFNGELSRLAAQRSQMEQALTKAKPGVDTTKLRESIEEMKSLQTKLRQAMSDVNAMGKSGYAKSTLYQSQSQQIRATGQDELRAFKAANKQKEEELRRFQENYDKIRQQQLKTATMNRTSFDGAMAYSKNTKSLLQEKQAIEALKAAREKLNPATAEGARKIAELNKEIRRHNESIAKATEGANRLKSSHSNLLNISQQLGRQLALMFSVSQIKDYALTIAKVRGEMELQQVSLRSILQNRTKADEIFNKAKALAVQSPFRVGQLVTYVKQLAAYRIESDKLFDTTKRLADVSAGLGVDMQRLILAYGQVKAAAFLRGTEVRQFTEAGVNMYGELQSYFKEVKGEAYTTAQIVDMISKRKVTFEDVEQVFLRLTNQGGLFYDMQRIQSETLYGKMEKLKDQLYLMQDALGKDNQGFISGTVDVMAWLLKHWEPIVSAVKKLGAAIALVGLYSLQSGTQLKMMFTASIASNATKAQGALALLGTGFSKLTTIVKTFGTNLKAAIVANPILAGIAAILYAINAVTSHYSKLSEAKEEINRQQDEETVKISKLTRKYEEYARQRQAAIKARESNKDYKFDFDLNKKQLKDEYETVKEEYKKRGFEIPVNFGKFDTKNADKAVAYFKSQMQNLVEFSASVGRSIAEDDNSWFMNNSLLGIPISADSVTKDLQELQTAADGVVEWAGKATRALSFVGSQYDKLSKESKKAYDAVANGPREGELQANYLVRVQEALETIQNYDHETGVKAQNITSGWFKGFSSLKQAIEGTVGLFGGFRRAADEAISEVGDKLDKAYNAGYFTDKLSNGKVKLKSEADISVMLDTLAAERKFSDYERWAMYEWAKKKFGFKFEPQKGDVVQGLNWVDEWVKDYFANKTYKIDVGFGDIELDDKDVSKAVNAAEKIVKAGSEARKDAETLAKGLKALASGARAAKQKNIKVDDDIRAMFNGTLPAVQATVSVEAVEKLGAKYQAIADKKAEILGDPRRDKKAENNAKKHEADIWQARISVLEKMNQRYEELRKKYGRNFSGETAVAAFRKAAHEAQIADKFLEGFIPDKKSTAKKLEELLSSPPVKSTAKQRADYLSKVAELKLKVDLDAFQKEMDKVKRVIDKSFDGYTLRTKLFDLGLHDFEINGMGGIFKDLPNTLTQVRNKIEKELNVPLKLRDMDIDELLGLSEYDGVGEAVLKQYQEARKKLYDSEKQEAERVTSDLLKEYRNKLTDQLALDLKYYKDREKIKAQFADSPELQKEMLENQDRDYKKSSAEQSWKDFQNSDYYQKLFDSIDNAPVHILKDMREQLNALKGSLAGMDPTNLKNVYNQIEKLEKTINEKDPIGALTRGFKDYIRTLKGYKDDTSIQDTTRKMLWWKDEAAKRKKTQDGNGVSLQISKDEYDKALNAANDYRSKKGVVDSGYDNGEQARLDAIVEAKKQELSVAQQVFDASKQSYEVAKAEVDARQKVIDENQKGLDTMLAGFDGCISLTEQLTSDAEGLANVFSTKVGSEIAAIGQKISGFAKAIRNMVKAVDGVRKSFTNLSKPAQTGADGVKKITSNTQEATKGTKKMTKAAAEGGKDVSKTMSETVDETGKMAVETTETATKAGETLVDSSGKAMENTATTTAESLKTIERASAILAIISAAIQLATMVASLFNDDDDKQKLIEELQEKVKDLEWAYERLKKSMDNAWDIAALIKYKNESVANLEAQAEAYRQMAAAERDKKDSDEAQARDYERKADEIGETIKSLAEDMKEALGGFGSDENYKSASQAFADAWVDAFNEGSDALDALNTKMDEYFTNLIKKQLMLRASDKYLKPVFKKIDQILDEGSLGGNSGYNVVRQELKEAMDLASDQMKGFHEFALNLMDELGWSGTNSTLSALQQGITNITEEQAAALESLLNSMRFFLANQSQDVHEILSELRLQAGRVSEENPMLSELKAQTGYLRNMSDKMDSIFVRNVTKGGSGLQVYVANL